MPTRDCTEPASVSRFHGHVEALGAQRAGDAADQPLGALGDDLPVRVGLVPLEHRELGVVLRAQALVAEVLADLVDALEAADDQALEVELGGDAQVHRPLERVEVRHERAGQCPAVDRLQDRGLDLDEALVVEEAPDRGDDLGARDEDLARLRVGDQVELAVAQARLGVRQPVVLLGRRAQRLRQQRPLADRDRQLAAAGLEDRAVGADEVAEVHRQQALERLVAEDVASRLQLDPARCGRRGRGTPSSPGRGARAGGRRRAPARRSRRRVRVLHAAPWRPRSPSRPRRRAGRARSPPPADPRACGGGRRGVLRTPPPTLMRLRSW